jgi:microcystin-dependent protein
MADPFVAEIRIFGFNFAPTGWATCDGQILPISQNTALFSLLGTTYGGNGQSTFALPNLQGSAPLHVGGSQPGPGLSFYNLGQQSGSDFITLLNTEMPAHNHFVVAAPDQADNNNPDPTKCLANSQKEFGYQSTTNTNLVNMAFQAITPAGGSLPHNNLMPYLTLTFCIALQGVFPPRT